MRKLTFRAIAEHFRSKAEKNYKMPNDKGLFEGAFATRHEMADFYEKCSELCMKVHGEWIDHTDYCPSSYGDGCEQPEPIWNWECPFCGRHIFEQFPPGVCPHCNKRVVSWVI